jgi:RNA polymerase sigma-70 factor, ECF subfamily
VTEEELMRAYVQGNQNAFNQLFAKLGPRVHGFFMRTFRSTTVAEDLTQITFLKLHKARDAWRHDAPLRPWVFTIAARVRLDELRRRFRLPASATEEDLEALPAANTSEEREHAHRAERVRAAVDALPEGQRVVVHLHRFEGLTFTQIAAVLGLAEGAVRVRASRAYDALGQTLASMLTEDA